MQKKIALSLILIISLSIFYVISQMPLINYMGLKYLIALFYIGLSSISIHLLLKEKRRLPFYLKIHLLASSILFLSYLYLYPSYYSFSAFLVINTIAIYTWYLYSYKQLYKNKLSLGRYKIPLQIKIVNYKNLNSELINISDSGCLVKIESELKKNKNYKIEIVYNNKILSINAKLVRKVPVNLYAFQFLGMDQRHYQSMGDFLEATRKSANYFKAA